MKKLILYLTFLTVFLACSSSDNESSSSGSTDSEACTKIKEGVKSALDNYSSAAQSTTIEKCQLYLKALQDQQIICGDADGEIQNLIDSLQDCSDDT